MLGVLSGDRAGFRDDQVRSSLLSHRKSPPRVSIGIGRTATSILAILDTLRRVCGSSGPPHPLLREWSASEPSSRADLHPSVQTERTWDLTAEGICYIGYHRAVSYSIIAVLVVSEGGATVLFLIPIWRSSFTNARALAKRSSWTAAACVLSSLANVSFGDEPATGLSSLISFRSTSTFL